VLRRMVDAASGADEEWEGCDMLGELSNRGGSADGPNGENPARVCPCHQR